MQAASSSSSSSSLLVCGGGRRSVTVLGWYVGKQAWQAALLPGAGGSRDGEGISSPGVTPKPRAWAQEPLLSAPMGVRPLGGVGPWLSPRGRAAGALWQAGWGRFLRPGFLFPFHPGFGEEEKDF